MDVTLHRSAPPLDAVAKSVSQMLSVRGVQTPGFETSAIILNFDLTAFSGPTRVAPSFFSIERRLNFSYGDNVYFSRAPVGTGDHLKILSQLERDLQQ